MTVKLNDNLFLVCDTDYKAQIQKRAEELKLSMNEYILTLIENDMKIKIPRGLKIGR